MLTASERDCLVRLEIWREKIEGLLGMFTPTGILARKDVCSARERFASIKRDLETECHLGAHSVRTVPRTEAQQRYYYPALSDALSTLRIPTNAVPEGWVSSLFQASLDLSRVIDELRTNEKHRD
jgi:hypothetical protein